MAEAMSLESLVATEAYFAGAVQIALDAEVAAAVRALLACAGPPAVSAAVAASDVTASARAAGFLASALRMPVFMTDIYIGRVGFCSSSHAKYSVNSGGRAAKITTIYSGLCQFARAPRPVSRCTSAAQDIAGAAPASAHVVKAFNAVFGNALSQDRPLDVLMAGDDAQAKASVSAFIESLGLRPLDAGPLAMARWLEGTGLVMMGLGRYGVGNFNFTLDVNLPG